MLDQERATCSQCFSCKPADPLVEAEPFEILGANGAWYAELPIRATFGHSVVPADKGREQAGVMRKPVARLRIRFHLDPLARVGRRHEIHRLATDHIDAELPELFDGQQAAHDASDRSAV